METTICICNEFNFSSYLGLGATGLPSCVLEVAVSSSLDEFDDEW